MSQTSSRDEERQLAWKAAETQITDAAERAAERIRLYALIGLENAFRDADENNGPYPDLAPSHPHACVAAAVKRWLRGDA